MENRNEACEMEVAVMGSRAKLGTKEGGKLNQKLGGMTEFKSGPIMIGFEAVPDAHL